MIFTVQVLAKCSSLKEKNIIYMNIISPFFWLFSLWRISTKFFIQTFMKHYFLQNKN